VKVGYYPTFLIKKMKRKEIEEKVNKIIKPVLDALSVELVDVEFKKEPAGWVLRVYIDKENGVDLDTCQKVSEAVNPLLDAEDLIPTRYFFEVSSPGVERPLKRKEDYKKFVGEEVFVSTFSPVGSRRKFKGKLREALEEKFILECEGKLYEVDYDNVSKAHLVVEIEF
jgi:ribosome maturation factor RimP